MQVTKLLKERYCQPPPPGCPTAVYKIMVDCWWGEGKGGEGRGRVPECCWTHHHIHHYNSHPTPKLVLTSFHSISPPPPRSQVPWPPLQTCCQFPLLITESTRVTFAPLGPVHPCPLLFSPHPWGTSGGGTQVVWRSTEHLPGLYIVPTPETSIAPYC